MSKRKNSIKKKILYPVLLGLVTLSSTAMATIPIGVYNGATKHYRKGKEHNSPVLGAAGLATGLVENIRLFGPYTPAYKEDGSRDYAKDESEDPIWQITKILFPSTGGTFTSESQFETNFGKNVDKVQSNIPLLSFVNDLREGKDVDVETLKNALFLTLKERPPYDSQKEQADLEKIKNEVPKIQVTTKADFIKALRGLKIDANLKKEMIGYATNKYKPKDKPNDLDAGRLEELQGILIGLADQSINATIQKKQTQEEERFKQRFFKETLTPLIESIQQAVKNEKDSIFPAYTTEQLIESFFSHKFNTEEDIQNHIKATPDDIVDPKVPFVSEPARTKEILEHDKLDMDDLLSLAALEMAESPIPYQSGISPVSNGPTWHYDRGTDQFKKEIKSFADCVDVMGRHMANMLLYNRNTQAFDVTPLHEQQKKFAEGSPQFKRLQNAIEFFEKYQSPMMANNGDLNTRSQWNRVIADLNVDGIGPKVDYVKGANELDTGHINMLRMFQNLFSLELAPFPVLEIVNEVDPEKEKEALIQILQKQGLKVDPFPVLKAKAEAIPEQVQEAQEKLDKDILSWKAKARESIQKKFEEDRINWTLSSFNKVFSFMNPDLVYDFEPQDLYWSPARNDVMGDITVLVKKSEKSAVPLYSFRMYQGDGHGAVKNIAYPKNQAALEIETKPAAIEPLTAEESLWLLFPQLAKTKTTEILYQMMPRLLADNDSKINFISLLKTMDWQSMPHLATQEIAGFLSNILPTLGWDDPDTLRRITGSIFGVILDKDENLNETLPQEVREAFFRQTQALEFEGVIKPNLAKVLPYFQNDVLKTSDLKIRFIEFLNGFNWVEVTEDDASKMTGLLSRTLDSLSLDTPESNVRFIGALSGIDWSKISEENTSKIKRLLSTTLDTFSRDDKFTDLMLSVFLDKTGRLKDVPQIIQDAFFDKTQMLSFEKDIPDSFVKVLPRFKNEVLRRPDQTPLFLESLSRVDWKGASEESVQGLAGLLTKVLSPRIASPGNARVPIPRMPPKRGVVVPIMRALPQKITTAIVNVFLDKDGRFKYVPEKIQEAFFTGTQALAFQEAIKPNFTRILPHFQKDVLTTESLKVKFVNSLRDMDWKEVPEGDIKNIAGMLSKVLDTFPWDSPAALTSSIMNVLLDKTGALNALLPREIQEVFFSKTQSLLFKDAITSDFFLGLSKILPRFIQAKDKVTQLTISGGEGKIEEFPESLGSLTLSKVKVGTVALAKLPSLNSLSFEDVTLDKLDIDPAHSHLKMTTKALSVSEIQGLENLDIFKETLSSKDPFFNEITGLEAIKFTNPNHKIETLSFEGDAPSGRPRVHPSRIEGLTHLPNLHVLDLSGSQALSIEDFESLSQLKKVRVSGALFGAHRFSEKHQTIEDLYIHDLGLQEIQGHEHLTELKKLTFTGASLGTLKFLPSSASLEEIEVKGSKIGEIQGLEHLTQLKKLAFTADETLTYPSELDSLTFSASNAKLEELSVVRSYVNSIQGLGHLKGLRKLDLTGAGSLTTLTFEDELPNLRVITANQNPHIEEINGLDKLPNLESLSLWETPSLKALSFTGSNEHLKSISLANSGVAVLEGLDTLPNLETLWAPDAGNLRSVKLSSVNAKLKNIELSGLRLTSVEGLEELSALETLKLGTLRGPQKLTLPEDVKFTQLWGGRRIEIERVPRPAAGKIHEEND